ncbi:MAG: oxidative damage protection protein [Anaerolineae bacterium]
MFSRFFKGDNPEKKEGGQSGDNPETPADSSAAGVNPSEAATPPAPPSPSVPLTPQPRMVMCAKLKRRLPGLDRPPFSGELGQRIYDNISALAWDMWKRQSVILVNHYGLVGADPEARRFLTEQMEVFLFGDEDEPMPEGWAPEDQGPGKGGAKGAPAPAKGAAPRK